MITVLKRSFRIRAGKVFVMYIFFFIYLYLSVQVSFVDASNAFKSAKIYIKKQKKRYTLFQ